MAILTGAIMYRGSFKSIRNYRNLHDPRTFAGEKGGANRDLIMNNPAFVRTRENMCEFGGCALAVKSIRRGFQNLLPEQADAHFTGRLTKMVKAVNLLDNVGPRGRRSILFSSAKRFLNGIVFNDRVNLFNIIQNHFSCNHSISRVEATLVVAELTINLDCIPPGASHFRVQNHLSVVSDWVYAEANHRYEAVSLLSALNAYGYSAYTPVRSTLSTEVVVAFPAGTIITDDCSVMQCVGVEFYARSFGDVYLPLKGGSMKVGEVY